MKKISIILALFCAVLLLAKPGASRAQTISFDSVSATQFCAGDPLSVTFTVTGYWGHKNAFSLQMSNENGSFSNGFKNLGSIIDTLPGTFTIVSSIPIDGNYVAGSIKSIRQYNPVLGKYDTIYDTTVGSRFRFRIMGAYPDTVSADNGTDVMIGSKPAHVQYAAEYPFETLTNAVVGVPKYLLGTVVNGFVGAGDTVHWSFGEGANPASAIEYHGFGSLTQYPTYSTPGLKTVTLTTISPGGGSCTMTDSVHVFVYDCTPPVVPNDAIVVSSDTSLWYYCMNSHGVVDSTSARSQTFWINPGVTVRAKDVTGYNTVDTIFAEPGANIIGGRGNVIYLKPGATVDLTYDGVIIHASGVSIRAGDVPTLECPNLSFDYSHAPPNSIMFKNGAVQDTGMDVTLVELSPNPTTGLLTMQSAPSNARIQVMNVLGDVVREIAKTADANVSLDLSKLPSGTYYVRLTSNGGVMTKKVVKE